MDAFCYVVTAHRAAALGAARSILEDWHQAEDAVQEAFLIAFRKLPDLRVLAAFPGWLRAIVRSAAIRVRRRTRPELAVEDLDPAADRARDVVDDAVLRAEQRALVRAAVAELSPRAQGAIERYYLRGLSIQQTADELGVPPGTVKRRLYEARERLRGRLVGLLDLSPRTPTPRAGSGLRFPL
ncbi:MAG: sigma-70 family RNA polymerase sigma factor [Planctomycetes bacterium]|nr:sigma-70 family RNA polymerase sigma factor [Planctomycetota bacterium]